MKFFDDLLNIMSYVHAHARDYIAREGLRYKFSMVGAVTRK